MPDGADGRHEIDSARYSIDTKPFTHSHFTLHDLSADDSGNYSCILNNRFGSDSQWSVLEVKGNLCSCFFVHFTKFSMNFVSIFILGNIIYNHIQYQYFGFATKTGHH